ncbi:4Fe-4S binding protein [Streptosporangium sp. NPDC006007]|uniref:NuoI/complex I 23 kDa subunit family protein n=1 Tax=Streptosporangium sp. NPDC006007 TaxID=3154575 RepID=UPI0033ACCD6E
MLSRSVTQRYPEVQPELPPRSRGVIGLVEENCTVCMLCARECPDWCIYIDSHKETVPAPEGGRPRARNMLDRFAIDFSLCMYCGICIEVCPFDALFWSPEFEYAEGDIRNLLHEKDRLTEWARTVPPPPAHEPGADPPKEFAATSRPARPAPPPGSLSVPAGTVRPAPHPADAPSESPRGTDASESGGGTDASAGTPGHPSSAPSADVSSSSSGAAAPQSATGGSGAADRADTTGTGRSAATGRPDAAGARPGRGPGRPERPARRASAGHASVRAIRPPGALPKKNGPPAETSVADTSSPDGPPDGTPTDGTPTDGTLTDGPPDGTPPDGTPPDGASAGDLSTGGPSAEKLSTGKGGVSPAGATSEQTSATYPNGESEEET